MDLGIIGLTDHHTVDFVSDMQNAAANTVLVVLPGIELSFVVGEFQDVYLLALFSPGTSQTDLNMLVDEWKIPDSAKGNCHYRMEVGIDKVISDVSRYGGMLISAHADKDETRKRVIPILIRDHRIRLFDFKYPHTAEDIQKHISHPVYCFTFSDSHRIEDIGSKYSKVDFNRNDLKQLRRLVG